MFDNSADSLRQEIKRITGVDVREATVEVESAGDSIAKAFATGTVVEVLLLAENLAGGTQCGTNAAA